MVIKTLASWTNSFFWNRNPVVGHFIKTRDQHFFYNLKQMDIINLCNSVVEPRCAYTKYIYNPLALKNVVFTADVTVLCRAL